MVKINGKNPAYMLVIFNEATEWKYSNPVVFI
jgi:hypothetical protein